MSEISMEPYTDEISMQQSTKDDIVIDVPGHDVKVQMINDGLQKYVSSSDQDSDRRSIYRVEPNLKNAHEPSTFHPKLVSIGPFHHKESDHLKLMEQHKWRFLSNFLNNPNLYWHCDHPTTSSSTLRTKKIHCLVAAMEKLEAGARNCYSERFDDLGSNVFVMMMILDGCFIIQLLLLFEKSGHSCEPVDDPMNAWRSMLHYLRHDLLLLENQLPFIVLQEIFNMSGINKEKYKLTDLILDFFNPVLNREKKVLDACKTQLLLQLQDLSNNNKDSCPHNHLLHLFMSSFQTRKPVHHQEDTFMSKLCVLPKRMRFIHRDQDMSIHCVTELKEAGVGFKKRDRHDLLDIEFKGGKLHIPTLFIDANTVPVLLNFIAYEQRHHSIKPYFTSYLMFLDYLVNSSKDVEHLHYKGIINHGLGSDEEVATLFNKLCKEVVQDLGDDNYLSPVFKQVNQYFAKLGYRWMAAWKHEHFKTPWTFSSFLAAIFLLVLTFLQTYFSMYAYFRPQAPRSN